MISGLLISIICVAAVLLMAVVILIYQFLKGPTKTNKSQETMNESQGTESKTTVNDSNTDSTIQKMENVIQIDDAINKRFMESKNNIHKDWFSSSGGDQGKGSLVCYSMASNESHCGIFLLMNYVYAFTGTLLLDSRRTEFKNSKDFRSYIIEDLKKLQLEALEHFEKTHKDEDKIKNYKNIMVKNDNEFQMIFNSFWSFELICFVLHKYFPQVVPICIARTPPKSESPESFSFSYSQLELNQKERIYILLYLSQNHWYIGQIIQNGQPSIFTTDWSSWYPIMMKHFPSTNQTLNVIKEFDNPVNIYAQMLYTMSDELEYTQYFC
jgi:hypothetical protein